MARKWGRPGTPGDSFLKKQSQFAKRQNDVKLNMDKGLWRKTRFWAAKKQSQFQGYSCHRGLRGHRERIEIIVDILAYIAQCLCITSSPELEKISSCLSGSFVKLLCCNTLTKEYSCYDLGSFGGQTEPKQRSMAPEKW